jgi:hypothetical protein
MSDIEGVAKDYAAGPIVGHGRDFYREGQEALAKWAFLKTLMFDCTSFAGPSIMREHFEYFYEHRSPPPDTYIWMAGLEPTRKAGKRLGHFEFHGLALSEEPLDPPADDVMDGYVATFSVNHLVFKTFAHTRGSEGAVLQHRGGIARCIRQIWPVQSEPVRWPPGPALTVKGLGVLAGGPLVRTATCTGPRAAA